MRPRRKPKASGGGVELVQLALLGEAMADAEDVAVFVWDDDRRYVAANATACRLAGVTLEELLAMRVGDLSPDRASPHFEEAQRHSPLTGSSTVVRRDGTTVELSWITFRTKLAGLPYMASVCWPRG